MQTQTSFAELEYISKKKLTQRERFLAQIKAATPWAQLVAVIEPRLTQGQPRPPAHRAGAHAQDVHRAELLWAVGRRD
jgi:IS5 family transposase